MRLMKIVSFSFSLLLGVSLNGQETSFDPASQPEATRILEQFELYVTSNTAIEATFSVNIHVPGEDPIHYPGSLIQNGELYWLNLGSYQIISDGTTRWVHDVDGKEVTIYDADSDSEISTPLEYLRIYKKERFEYRLAEEYATQDQQCIEFKPTDKYSDYSKARLSFNAQNGMPTRVELFEKGGVRTDMRIESIREGATRNSNYFKYDTTAHPEVHVEDLRID